MDSVRGVHGAFLQAKNAGAAQDVSLTPCALDSPRAPDVHLEGAVSILVLGLTSFVNLSKPLFSLGAL